MSAERTQSPALADEQVAKKRKLEIIDLIDSSDDEAATAPSGPPGGKGATDPPEIATLQQELKAAEESIRIAEETVLALRAKREGIATRLDALGQRVLVKRLTTDQLKLRFNSELDAFMQLHHDSEDLASDCDDDDKALAIQLVRMKCAVDNEYPSDGTSYIDEDEGGKWIDFEPTWEEVDVWDWGEAIVLWE